MVHRILGLSRSLTVELHHLLLARVLVSQQHASGLRSRRRQGWPYDSDC